AAPCAATLPARRSRCRTVPNVRCCVWRKPRPPAPPSIAPARRARHFPRSMSQGYLRSSVFTHPIYTLTSRYLIHRCLSSDAVKLFLCEPDAGREGLLALSTMAEVKRCRGTELSVEHEQAREERMLE